MSSSLQMNVSFSFSIVLRTKKSLMFKNQILIKADHSGSQNSVPDLLLSNYSYTILETFVMVPVRVNIVMAISVTMYTNFLLSSLFVIWDSYCTLKHFGQCHLFPL